MSGPFCPKLSNKILLNEGSVYSGEVSPLPVSIFAQDLEELKDRSAAPSLYVVPGDGGFCAYPIRGSGGSNFKVSEFFSPELKSLPNLFGKPSSLAIPQNIPFTASLYDAGIQKFFAQDSSGKHWYLVGGQESYGNFIAGIVQYADSLLEEWRRDPWNFHKREWKSPEEEPLAFGPTHAPSPMEAWTAMDRFGAWLAMNDPHLYVASLGKMHYSERGPESGCPAPKNEDQYYAFYTTHDDRILLLPRTIRLMQARDFSAAAQVVAHEVAHRENAQSGLILPSIEMMQQSVGLFLGRAAEENPVYGIFLGLSDPLIRMELMCRRLPMLPEEELDAFSVDLNYGRGQPLMLQSLETQEESIDAIVWLIEQVDREFPPAWRSLMADYVNLAQANHGHLPENGKRPLTKTAR